mgnify:CR=1 FL=1
MADQPLTANELTWPGRYPCCEPGRPPNHCGLGQADRLILTAHLEAGIIMPEKIWYNTLVGEPPTWIDGIPDGTRRNWVIATYCKRPDVVWLANGLLYVAEIKPYASYIAFGQATQYARLARRLATNPNAVRAAILTDRADPDLILFNDGIDPILYELGYELCTRPERAT